MSFQFLLEKEVEETTQEFALQAQTLVFAMKNELSFSQETIIQDVSLELEKISKTTAELRIAKTMLRFIQRMLRAEYDSEKHIAIVNRKAAINFIASLDGKIVTANRKLREAANAQAQETQRDAIIRHTQERNSWQAQLTTADSTIARIEAEEAAEAARKAAQEA